jgi:hypothetical protein
MVRYLCKSMLKQASVPLAVQRQEFFEALGDVSMQSKGMAVLRFDAEHKQRRSSWSARQ